MTVSALSAAGVVTTQKAAAADVGAYTVVVGKNRTFNANQLNWHETYFYPTSAAPFAPVHIERSVGNNAFAFEHTVRQTYVSQSNARIGVKWYLNPPAGKTWAQVKNTPHTVKVKLTYSLHVQGNATARLLDTDYVKDFAGQFGGSKHPNTKTVTTTLTFRGGKGVPPCCDVWSLDNIRNGFYVASLAGVGSTGGKYKFELATAQVTVNSIELRFGAS